jgi:putative serine protease PepD
LLSACTFPVRFATADEVRQATAPTPIVISGGGTTAPPPVDPLDQIQATMRRLITQVGPSVVRVEAGGATGSGLVIDAAGTVATPASLVNGSRQVTVTTASGQQYSGTVVGSDAASDVAVVRLSAATGLTAVPLADSTGVQLGDVVVAIGNQVGSSGTASQGIVSQLAGTMTSGSVQLSGLIVTTAPMAAGTSGSALVNIAGQVIGMTTLGSTGTAGQGVAIPSNQVNTIAQQLLGAGTQAKTASLGVTVTDAAGGGATIQSVTAGGPAARAGLLAGWTIVAIGGHSVANTAAIKPILAGYTPGQTVTVTVKLPSGSTRSVQVVLGSA